MDEGIINIAKKASLKLHVNNKAVDIKHTLCLNDKSTWGVLFFLFGGVFLITAPLIKTSDVATKVIGIVLGLLLVAITILTFIRQVADGLKIKDRKITYRYNLKRKIIPYNYSDKVVMKTEVLKIRRQATLGTDFILVTIYLKAQNEETPILKFQMDNLYSENAMKLGYELTQIINARFRQ